MSAHDTLSGPTDPVSLMAGIAWQCGLWLEVGHELLAVWPAYWGTGACRETADLRGRKWYILWDRTGWCSGRFGRCLVRISAALFSALTEVFCGFLLPPGNSSFPHIATRWTVWGSNSGGGRDFPCRPDRPRCQPNLYNVYRVFPGVKAAWACCLSPTSL